MNTHTKRSLISELGLVIKARPIYRYFKAFVHE